MARGKKKNTAPRDPAPVSGPGALSQRTDAAPPAYASPTGERPYGERKAVEAQAAAAPMRAVQEGVFGPTERPDQPATAGAPFGPGRTPPTAGIAPSDPDVLLRALYDAYPHPDLLRLLSRRAS